MNSYPKTAPSVYSSTGSGKRAAGPQFVWAPAPIVAHQLIRQFKMEPATAVLVATRCGFLVEVPHGS